MRIVTLIKKLRLRIMRSKNPTKYARTIGVNFPEGELHIYGKVSWNTEPWLISLGRNVWLTAGVKFLTHDGGVAIYRKEIPDLEITKPITVGDNVYIGTNTLILPGVNIGNNVIIGAGAVVSRDIPDNSVAVGVPAKVIKTADEYLEKAKRESIHLGHLKGKQRDEALKKCYGYNGNSKGIYS